MSPGRRHPGGARRVPGSRRIATLGALGLAAACLAAPAVADPAEGDAWAVWTGSQGVLLRPAGAFDPPAPDRAFGVDIAASLVPPHRHLGLRLEYGSVEHASHVENIRVANPNGYWVDDLARVQTGSRISWAMVGGEWNTRPQASGFYCYAAGGMGRVAPMEVLGDGHPVIQADVPGLPPSHNGFAWAAGAGSRLRIPGHKKLAFTSEIAYRHLGHANYVASPGVRGEFPDARYVVAQGAVEAWTAQVGLALNHARY